MDMLTIFNHRDNILAFAKERLTDEHQQIFVEHFLMIINAPDDPFPITAEKAMEWLGYEHKNKFKLVVIKHLECNVGYKLSLDQAVERKNKTGGQNCEDIRISLDGFKTLEMVAMTKKGDTIRSYYPMLEKLVYDFSIHQHQKALQDAQQQIVQAQQQATNLKYILEAERENIARKLRRRVNIKDSKDVVYIYQEAPNMIKVGETHDAEKREASHRSSSYLNRVVYAKKCSNRKLLEKVVHHILDEYRVDPQREWFNCSFDIAQEALNTAQLFLDGLVDRCSLIHKNQLCSRLETLFQETLPSTHNEPSSEEPPPQEAAYDDVDTDGEMDHDDSAGHEEEIGNVVNPLDFDKFIEERCVKDDSKHAFTAEVFGAHRLWGRCCLKTTHTALHKYLHTRFGTAKRYDPKTNATLTCILGICLKPLEIPVSNPPTDVDRFVQEKCVVGYTYRIAVKDIYAAFAEWKKQSMPGYTLSAEESKRLCSIFSRMFVPSGVYVKNMTRRGYFGVDLKTSQHINTGLKLANKLKKKVLQIDIETKRVVETYESLSDAARAIGRCNGNLSSDIKYDKPWNGYLFKYAT